MSSTNDARTDPAGSDRSGADDPTTIPRPADEQVVYRGREDTDVVGAERHRGFDVPATIGGALAALGTLLLLTSLLGTLGAIGFQRGIDGDDLSVPGLVAGLVVLLVAGLVGGWVAGRIARHHGARHGLVAALWLVVLAAALAALAALAGDDADVRGQVGLPRWFDSDAWGVAALITGLVALALLLLGGWLGGWLADRHAHHDTVEVVATRRRVRRHDGGIVARGTR